MNTSTTCFSRHRSHRSYPRLALLLAGAALILIYLNVTLGASGFSRLGEVLEALSDKDSFLYRAVVFLRLPRCVACIGCGAALAAAGAVLQTVLNNSLATPGVIGVNSGSGFAVVLAAVLFSGSSNAKTVFAFTGALTVCLMIYLIARVSGASRTSIILAGVAISSLFSAGSDAIVTLYPTTVMDKTAFFIGSFSTVTYAEIKLAMPFIAVGALLALAISSRLDILITGDDVAASLGLHVEHCRLLAIVSAALLSAGSVVICGLLGFVGLVVPHVIRLISGQLTTFQLISLSMLAGAALVLLCDLAARTLFSPYEIPVGIILSFVGAPFFLWLILNRKRGRRVD